MMRQSIRRADCPELAKLGYALNAARETIAALENRLAETTILPERTDIRAQLTEARKRGREAMAVYKRHIDKHRCR